MRHTKSLGVGTTMHFGRLPKAALRALLVIFTASAPAYAAAPNGGQILHAGGPTAIAGSYVVVFKDSVVPRSGVDATSRGLAVRHGGTLKNVYRHALRGMEIKLTETQAKRLAVHPLVKYVEQNHMISIAGTQTNPPSWGLDRIDQRNLPLNSSYAYPNTASNVRIYIIDSGIRATHTDFGGRAVWGTNTMDTNNTDCNGHGTHVAGTAAGSWYGVAKGASLTAVKVLDCSGNGTVASVVAGVEWVTVDHAAGQLAVANMSISGGFSQAVNDAVTASIADGITYTVAAGNEATNACDRSPASTPNAITIGATNSTDARWSLSNVGSCLDLFAPGDNITSAWNTSNTAAEPKSGTSMASPHAVGAAALILSANPSYSPQQIRDSMVNSATSGVVTDAGAGSPNKLLNANSGSGLATVYYIKTKNVGSGRVEVHSATAVTNYKTGMSVATRFYPNDSDNGWFQMVGPDLFFIKTKNVTSGRVELHSATAASNYQSGIDLLTVFSPAEADNGWFQMADVTRDGIKDLVFIKTKNVGSGHVELFVSSGATSYQSIIWGNNVTTFSPADASNGWFQIFDADLVFIKTRNTGSGKAEYFRATASSGYQSIIWGNNVSWFGTAEQNNGWFSTEEATGDGIADLVFIKTHNTGSGKVEVFIASGASGFQSIIWGNNTTKFSAPAEANNGWFQMDAKA